MEEFEFWSRQLSIDVLTAAYLLAGEPMPKELSRSVDIGGYAPKVMAVIRLIQQETGAVVRNPFVPLNVRASRPPPRRTSIEQAEFRRIAEKLGVALEQGAQQTSQNRWPWGEYETDSLRKLAAAAIKFWTLYDPSQPSTAPTNEQVAEWLVKQGVSENIARAMATILRADGLATGPRK